MPGAPNNVLCCVSTSLDIWLLALQDARYLDKAAYPRNRVYDFFFIRASTRNRSMFNECELVSVLLT